MSSNLLGFVVWILDSLTASSMVMSLAGLLPYELFVTCVVGLSWSSACMLLGSELLLILLPPFYWYYIYSSRLSWVSLYDCSYVVKFWIIWSWVWILIWYFSSYSCTLWRSLSISVIWRRSWEIIWICCFIMASLSFYFCWWIWLELFMFICMLWIKSCWLLIVISFYYTSSSIFWLSESTLLFKIVLLLFCCEIWLTCDWFCVIFPFLETLPG